MKKIISLLLTIGMLATLFVVPVSAAETLLFQAYPDSFVLGEGTTLNAEGDKVVFDAKGDSFSYTFDVDAEGIYIVAPYISELGDIIEAPLRDSFVMNLYVDGNLVSTTAGWESTPGVAGSYTEGRKWFDGMVKFEAGRHTIKIENALGSYKVDTLQVFSNETCVEANLPTTFKTYAGITATGNSFNRGDVSPAVGIATNMYQAGSNKITGVVGVPQDGVYNFTARTVSYYGPLASGAFDGTVATNTYNVTLAGKTVAVPNVTYTKRLEEKNVTLVEGVSLKKGVYPFEIACSGSGLIQVLFDTLTMTKVEGEPTFTYDNISFKTRFDAAVAQNGAAKVYDQWTTLAPNSSIDWKFTVPQSGYYTSKLTWNEYIYTYWNPRVFIDGACYYGAQVVGTGTIVSDPLGQTEALENTTFGTIYLTAGEHTVRVANGSNGYARIHQLDFVGTAPVANAAIGISADAYGTSTSGALEIVYDGKEGNVVKFTNGANVNYKVFASENGFYNVSVVAGPAEKAKITYAVSANDTDGKGTVTGVTGAAWTTTALTGSVYLNAGINDVLVSTTGATAQTSKFIFTPVAYADRVVNVKAAALYDANDDVATAIEANTEYTAVADIAGAYIGKPVTLMVGVYAGGKLVEAHSVTGKTVLGKTIENTFTTPAEAGDYTVKVFMFDGLGTLKPYTTTATVVNPAVAEAE